MIHSSYVDIVETLIKKLLESFHGRFCVCFCATKVLIGRYVKSIATDSMTLSMNFTTIILIFHWFKSTQIKARRWSHTNAFSKWFSRGNGVVCCQKQQKRSHLTTFCCSCCFYHLLKEHFDEQNRHFHNIDTLKSYSKWHCFYDTKHYHFHPSLPSQQSTSADFKLTIFKREKKQRKNNVWLYSQMLLRSHA